MDADGRFSGPRMRNIPSRLARFPELSGCAPRTWKNIALNLIEATYSVMARSVFDSGDYCFSSSGAGRT